LSLTDFLLSERGDLAAARRLSRLAITANGVPDRVVIDKSGAKLAGLQAVNVILKFIGGGHAIKIRQVKYLNKFLEQPSRGFHANPPQVPDHRFIKRITAPMSGFKAFHSAAASIAGIEIAHMIRKGQFAANKLSPFQ
jgi:putative transposase